jgi:hypothetical protein
MSRTLRRPGWLGPANPLVAPGRQPGVPGTRPPRRLRWWTGPPGRLAGPWQVGRVGRVAAEEPTVRTPAGARSDPLLVITVIDESPSQQDLDPHGLRHLGGRRLLHLLADDIPHPDDRLAVVHFSTRPGSVRRPTSPHRRRGRWALRRALRPAGWGDGTDIVAALRRTARLVPRRWPGRVVVLLLTDGQDRGVPAGPPAATAEAEQAGRLRDAVVALPPGSVHLVAIGGPPPPVWETIPLGSAYTVPALDSADEVEQAVTRPVVEAAGLVWRR